MVESVRRRQSGPEEYEAGKLMSVEICFWGWPGVQG